MNKKNSKSQKSNKIGKTKKPIKKSKAPNPKTKNSKQEKSNKGGKKSIQKGKKSIIKVQTNNKDKLFDLDLMRSHDFLSSTESVMTKIHRINHIDGVRYEVSEDVNCVSTILKLVLSINETNNMSFTWTIGLWNINQNQSLLPEGCRLTFVRMFERKDSEIMSKIIKRRSKISLFSSSSEENVKKQRASVNHDIDLTNAMNRGDSVVSFAAEVLITAPDDNTLEDAVNAVKNYITTIDEIRGLQYQIDINKQSRPLVLYGPNKSAGNQGMYVDLTSEEAGVASLFVDSGGDRTLGSEYIGYSVGKYIQSHAAYSFVNQYSMFVGNDVENKTYTIQSINNNEAYNMGSQIYMSLVASRAYMLKGQSVVHFVADEQFSAKALMELSIDKDRKVMVDVSEGVLNVLEPIDDGKIAAEKSRILTRFPAHINNIILLLNQFRDVEEPSLKDAFASATRNVLTDFFVHSKYWRYDAKYYLDDIRLFGTEHNQFKILSNFGQYVTQRKKDNTDDNLTNALNELDTIVNDTILSTIPSMDVTTQPIVDDLVKAQYRVVDLTGMKEGSLSARSNPSLNLMALLYLNMIIPSLDNGDAIFFHGISRMSSIAKLLIEIIHDCGISLDLIFTEKNQISTLKTLECVDRDLDFVVVDLYNNRVDKLVDIFEMSQGSNENLSQDKGAYFVRTKSGIDYIYLNDVL